MSGPAAVPPGQTTSPASLPPATRPQTVPKDGSDRAVEAGKGALFIGFAKIFFMVSGSVQRWLLAQVVSPVEYGAFSVVNNLISTVNNTVVQATTQAVSKFTAESDARVEAVKSAGLRLMAVFGTLLGLAVFFAAPALAALVRAPGYVGWFRLVAAIPFLYGFYSVFVGSANGQRRFRTQASFDVGFSTAKTVLVLAGAYAGRRLAGGGDASVTGAFIGFVLAAVIILLVSARTMGLPRSGGEAFGMVRLLAFAPLVAGYALLLNLALNFDLQLLRRFAGGLTSAARADALAGNYEALRNLALLPYQALIVITFVVFPLVSRATFDQDRETTKAYVRQTLRLALIAAGGMGVVLAARPSALLGILYRPEYLEGASALPILVAGICCLSLVGIACAIVNASGRPLVAVVLMAVSVGTGGTLAWMLARQAPPGPELLVAIAAAAAGGMLAGLIASLVYLQRRFGASLPAAGAARVGVALAGAVALGRVLPSGGRVLGLGTIAVVGLAYVVLLVVVRELGPRDREQLAKILRRRRRA